MVGPEVIFLTLFLNLVAGVQTVNVGITGDEVAQLEMRLDGVSIGTRDLPPWQFEVDFGHGIAPHRLEAITFDKSGAELVRAAQLVNTSRFEAGCLLGPGSTPAILRLLCRSMSGSGVRSTKVLVDGVPVTPDADGSILVPNDPGMHFVSAWVEFEDGIVARTEKIVSGSSVGRSVSELTAIPLVAAEGSIDLGPDDLHASHRSTETALTIRAVERSAPQIVAVVSREARKRLTMHELMARRDERQGRRFLIAPPGERWVNKVGGAVDNSRTSHRHQLPSLRQIDPSVEPQTTTLLSASLFPMTEPTAMSPQTVRTLAMDNGGKDGSREQRISDALIIAGAMAHAGGTPRAVLLVVHREDNDTSHQTKGEAVAFLKALNVPLVIWTTGGSKDVSTGWGEAQGQISGTQSMIEAGAELFSLLDHQWIAWVEGAWLPGEVVLSQTSLE